VVVEEFLDGEEASFFALVDGPNAVALASAQDHKAVGDGDTGPNTGGMGAYSPAPVVTPDIEAQVCGVNRSHGAWLACLIVEQSCLRSVSSVVSTTQIAWRQQQVVAVEFLHRCWHCRVHVKRSSPADDSLHCNFCLIAAENCDITSSKEEDTVACSIAVVPSHVRAVSSTPNTPSRNETIGCNTVVTSQVMEEIVLRTAHAMVSEGCPFRGVLFAGLMIKNGKAKLLEHNVRFGDPECQGLMARLDSDLLAALMQVRCVLRLWVCRMIS
jgi:hypothetical protein